MAGQANTGTNMTADTRLIAVLIMKAWRFAVVCDKYPSMLSMSRVMRVVMREMGVSSSHLNLGQFIQSLCARELRVPERSSEDGGRHYTVNGSGDSQFGKQEPDAFEDESSGADHDQARVDPQIPVQVSSVSRRSSRCRIDLPEDWYIGHGKFLILRAPVPQKPQIEAMHEEFKDGRRRPDGEEKHRMIATESIKEHFEGAPANRSLLHFFCDDQFPCRALFVYSASRVFEVAFVLCIDGPLLCKHSLLDVTLKTRRNAVLTQGDDTCSNRTRQSNIVRLSMFCEASEVKKAC